MTVTETPNTLPLEEFWTWLLGHPNCILRAGTPDTVIFDDDDLHWQLGNEGSTMFTQVLRGKRLMGEMLMNSDAVSYVEIHGGDREEEVFFDLIVESETDRVVAYFFVLSHGFDEDELDTHNRAAVH